MAEEKDKKEEKQEEQKSQKSSEEKKTEREVPAKEEGDKAKEEDSKKEAGDNEKDKKEEKEEKKEDDKKENKEEGEEEEVDERFKEIIAKVEEMSVVELADLVKALEKKFGVSAAAAAAPVGGDAGGGEEKNEFNVMLKSFGDQKINVIKAVKEITGLGLVEAKKTVESAPQTIKEGVKKEEAEEMKSKLEEAGAAVELQ